MSQKESKGKDNMGLAASQARLLTLTARKADVELNIMTFSSRKMAVTREMQQLSSEYYSKLNDKQVCYYANGKYNKISYNYLMGGTTQYVDVVNNNSSLKKYNSMVLTDYKGNVVLSKEYADILTSVMGSAKVSSPTYEEYAQMLEKVCGGSPSANDIYTVLSSGYVPYSVKETSGEYQDDDGSMTDNIKRIIDHYLPVFKAAAANGWTTEYEQYWQNNEDYISDALVSGVFQLAIIDSSGNYTTDDSLSYFVTAGYVDTQSTSDKREAITAWYEAEKLILTNKETYWDTEITNASTELEEIKTEIESVNSLIDDAIEGLNWNA